MVLPQGSAGCGRVRWGLFHHVYETGSVFTLRVVIGMKCLGLWSLILLVRRKVNVFI